MGCRMDKQYQLLKDTKWFGKCADEWLRHVVSIHFDPSSGSRYWLGRARALGIDVRNEVTAVDRLKILGPMNEDDLRNHPLEDFIPKAFLANRRDFILGETSGATGKPKITAYMRNEFQSAFVDYFHDVACGRGFPKGASWLWIGPSGPHIIGKAVGCVARRMDSMDPFSVDFDPRWAKKMKEGSFGARRYLQHVMDQVFDILQRQRVDVIFTTPVVLKELAAMMDRSDKVKIRGVHYGGISIDKEDFKGFKEDDFPNAVHLAGYGNTLFGLCLEVEESTEFDLDYFPPGPRMIPQVVSIRDGLEPSTGRLSDIVGYGEEGQVVLHRLDEGFFIPNMFERDRAVRIAPTGKTRSMGINLDGVRNPAPLSGISKAVKVGLY